MSNLGAYVIYIKSFIIQTENILNSECCNIGGTYVLVWRQWLYKQQNILHCLTHSKDVYYYNN